MQYEAETASQNFYALDANLRGALHRLMPDQLARWDATLSAFGAWTGTAVDAAAAYTDSRGHPVLESHDRGGEAVNRIRTNPAWDEVSRDAYQRGAVGINYAADAAPFTVTFVMGYLISQADVSLHCPVAMTGAMAYVLDRFASGEVKRVFLPDLVRTDGEALSGGTWATEQSGGSDLGATTTTSSPAGDHVLLNGLKWFASNPGGGLALATARPAGAPTGARGLGLYVVPLRLGDGRPNPMRFRRLKEKLGTTGIATAEIELTDTWGYEVAAPPRGLKLMMEALGFSRLHNAFAAAGLQRRAFLEAMRYCTHRTAFGERLTDMPMVQDEILKIMVPLEAGLGLALEAARTFDANHADPRADPWWLRLLIALAKYRTGEDANVACRTAIEVMGGNAYTEDYVTPRLLRDAQVMTLWEGPANIQALEVVRILGGGGSALADFRERVGAVLAATPEGLDDIAEAVTEALGECEGAAVWVVGEPERERRDARRLTDLMADTLAAALLLEEASHGHAASDGRKAAVARLFVAARLAPPPRRGIGLRDDPTHPHFDALAGYEALDIEAARNRVAGSSTG